VDAPDPTVSAVVQMTNNEERKAAGAPELHDNQATAQVKGWFTKAGFEVHAPFISSFSIGAKRSLFEETFGTHLVIEEGLTSSVTLEGGGRDLDVERLPEEIRQLIKTISFIPPPDFASVSG
jgi:hypothetical protein